MALRGVETRKDLLAPDNDDLLVTFQKSYDGHSNLNAVRVRGFPLQILVFSSAGNRRSSRGGPRKAPDLQNRPALELYPLAFTL
jgi:hypothetical protein